MRWTEIILAGLLERGVRLGQEQLPLSELQPPSVSLSSLMEGSLEVGKLRGKGIGAFYATPRSVLEAVTPRQQHLVMKCGT